MAEFDAFVDAHGHDPDGPVLVAEDSDAVAEVAVDLFVDEEVAECFCTGCAEWLESVAVAAIADVERECEAVVVDPFFAVSLCTANFGDLLSGDVVKFGGEVCGESWEGGMSGAADEGCSEGSGLVFSWGASDDEAVVLSLNGDLSREVDFFSGFGGFDEPEDGFDVGVAEILFAGGDQADGAAEDFGLDGGVLSGEGGAIEDEQSGLFGDDE